MTSLCARCSQELGPFETQPCPRLLVDSGYRTTLPDLGIYILEDSDGPLTVYDLVRSIRRDLGVVVNQTSLQAGISQDDRYCWAGKGLYGLYRHGLLPGPRNLAGVAETFLYCHGAPLEPKQLEFAMKHTGYRFQPVSLNQALNRDDNMRWVRVGGLWCYDIKRTRAAEMRLRSFGIARISKADFQRIVQRCSAAISVAIKEQQRRLA